MFFGKFQMLIEKKPIFGANKLCLRLFDASGSGNQSRNIREIAVDSYSTQWYLPIPLADRDYKVELGYKYGFNWMSLAFSSISHVRVSSSEQILINLYLLTGFYSESIPDISNPGFSEQMVCMKGYIKQQLIFLSEEKLVLKNLWKM